MAAAKRRSSPRTPIASSSTLHGLESSRSSNENLACVSGKASRRRPNHAPAIPVGHFHAHHSVARGKPHCLILQRVRDIRRSTAAGKAFFRQEQERGTRRCFPTTPAVTSVALAISEVRAD